MDKVALIHAGTPYDAVEVSHGGRATVSAVVHSKYTSLHNFCQQRVDIESSLCLESVVACPAVALGLVSSCRALRYLTVEGAT